jgi:2-polyprenyl-3-methyl-5-hydroxy-6-metoxy-1,4-benzoquinol methylase
MDEKTKKLVKALLDYTDFELETSFPEWISPEDGTEDELLKKLTDEYISNGINLNEDDYFANSIPRYKHYLSIIKNLRRGANVLEVGSAPGHLSICMYFLGLDLVCINLNALYSDFYPNPAWNEKLNVIEHNIEKTPIPFDEGTFDVVVFTEVLEHIAIRPPSEILEELHRVLVPGGKLLLSTPNICNISNIYALLKGANVFWKPDQFYGGLDRHNREYTPQEVKKIIAETGFSKFNIYGLNSHSNWHGLDVFPYDVLNEFGKDHPLLQNTIMVVATK